jgi:hypothetical protein
MDHIAVEYGIATALGLASGAIRFQRTWSCSGDGQRGEVSQKHLVWGGGDAGVAGYAFWRFLIDCGHHFLVRVGGNLKLIGEMVDFQELDDGEVLCWPQEMQN